MPANMNNQGCLGAAGEQAESDRLRELARRAEQVVHDQVEALRSGGRQALDRAEETWGRTRTVVTERFNEKPVSWTLGALAVGVLVGLLIFNSRDRS